MNDMTEQEERPCRREVPLSGRGVNRPEDIGGIDRGDEPPPVCSLLYSRSESGAWKEPEGEIRSFLIPDAR